jgi:hypothetical protein
MKTLDEVRKMFVEMGLGSEAERLYYQKLSQMGQESKKSGKLFFTTTTANTFSIKEGENGKLERNLK